MKVLTRSEWSPIMARPVISSAGATAVLRAAEGETLDD